MRRECPGWLTVNNTAHSVDTSNFLPQLLNYVFEDSNQYRFTSHLGNQVTIGFINNLVRLLEQFFCLARRTDLRGNITQIANSFSFS